MENKIDLVKRSAVQIFSEDSLAARLNSGEKLRIKLGADPSRPDLHLGHTVVLRQLKRFQDWGHEVVFVIGDFTAMIGDPTGKSKTRPKLTMEETRNSGRTYFEQVTKVLSPEKTVIEYNSKWLNALNFSDIINLSSKYTLARMLERDDFSTRFKEQRPLSLHELLYPLAQGYDSVALECDIEVGGTDQTFNLLVGRDLQRDYGQKPQEVITFPLLVGLDGVEKMSKSLDNYIGIDESAEVMFEKAMRIPDNVLADYFRLTTDIPLSAASELISRDIVEAHRAYGREIIRLYHGDAFIEAAEKRYNQVASGTVPENIGVVSISANNLAEGQSIGICDLVRLCGLAESNSDARRLIKGKGIKIDNQVVADAHARVKCTEGMVISRGKGKFIKLHVEV